MPINLDFAMIVRVLLGLGLLVGTAMPVLAAPPAIDCRRVSTTVDRVICTSPESVALDGEIAALYGRGMATFALDDRHRLAENQLAYLRRRKGCDWASHHSAHPGEAISECVHNTMEERLRSLRRVVDSGRF